MEGDFFIQASQFYKQMICGVRTEDGVQRSSTVFLNKDKSNYKAFGSNSTNIKEVLFDGIKAILMNNFLGKSIGNT